MTILHCMKRKDWEAHSEKEYYGHAGVAAEGFIHCSEAETFPLVAPNFDGEPEPLVLLCIDTDKVEPEIKWEDGGGGTAFPHIYGLLNTSAVVRVLPFLRDSQGRFRLNDELKDIGE